MIMAKDQTPCPSFANNWKRWQCRTERRTTSFEFVSLMLSQALASSRPSQGSHIPDRIEMGGFECHVCGIDSSSSTCEAGRAYVGRGQNVAK